MAALKTLAACGLAVVAVGLIYATLGRGDAENPPPSLPSEEIRFSSYDLTLEAVDGGCRIKYQSSERKGTLELGIAQPCRFIRPDDKALKVYRAEEAEVFAVVGGVPEYDSLDPLRTTRADCGTQVAGVIFSDDAFRVVEKTMGPGVYCAFMGLDQKDFWLFLNG